MPLIILVGVVFAVALEGCQGCGPHPYYPVEPCADYAASSVEVNVWGEDGGEVEGALVEYSVDGSEFMTCDNFQAACMVEEWDTGYGDDDVDYGVSSQWVCGWEVTGEITVRVSAEGYDTVEETVWTEYDGCHVYTSWLDVVITESEEEPLPNECDEVEGQAAWVLLQDADSGAGIDGDVSILAGSGLAQACDQVGLGLYACGPGLSGHLNIIAEAEGYEAAAVAFFAELDECVVDTQMINIDLVPAGPSCTTEAVASALVTIEGLEPVGECGLIPDPSVFFEALDSAPGEIVACELSSGTTFVCGEELGGNIAIYATASEHSFASAEIFVETDECHVITEELTLEVVPLP